MYVVARNFLIAVLAASAVAACSPETVEEQGKKMATAKIDLVKGIGDAVVEKGGKAAEGITHGAGNVLKGAQSGINKAFAWDLTQGDTLKQAGLEITQMQSSKAESRVKNQLDLYLVSTRATKGTLLLIAYDESQKEIGRIRHPFSMEAQEGRYETMALDERTSISNMKMAFVDFMPEADSTQK